MTTKSILKILSEMMADPRAKHYGAGYFQNIHNRNIVPLEYDDLGPHGDHDGYIGMPKYSDALGIDSNRARAFTEGVYGSYDDTVPKELQDYYDNSMYVPRGSSFPGYDDYFMKKYGMSPDEGTYDHFPELLRYRLWPGADKTLSITGATDLTPDVVHSIRDFHKRAQVDPSNTKKVVVSLEGNEAPTFQTIEGDDVYDPKTLIRALLQKYGQ